MIKRKGYSLIEIVVVIVIIAILATASTAVGAKQVARTRLQSAMTFMQTIESNLEEGITEMGFLDDVSLTSNSDGIIAYMNEMEDVYLNCLLDYGGASFKEIPSLPDGYGEGFQINILTPTDPWGINYTIFYMHSNETDNYRIVVASAGANNIWNLGGYESGYVKIADIESSDLVDDDIVNIMISR